MRHKAPLFVESLLSIEEAKNLTAPHLADLLLNTLKHNEIDLNYVLCQCYDGASVMKGWKGGVQALIEKALNRPIPYVHCFNHQLHLIVVHLVKEIPEVKQYFDYCTLIHKIFSTFKFKSYYNGQRTSRLLEQRWTGHLHVTEIIFNNYNMMLEALVSAIANEFDELDGTTVIACTGLLTVMKSFSFRFIMCMMLKLLKTLEPVDATLQCKERGLASSLPVIHAVLSCIRDYRSDEIFLEILDKCDGLIESENDDDLAEFSHVRTNSKRKKKPNLKLADNILTERCGFSDCGDQIANFKRIFFEIIDMVVNEMDERFVKDKSLFNLIDKIFDLFVKNVDELKDLCKLNDRIPIPPQEELICVQRYLNNLESITPQHFLLELYKQRTAFAKTYQMYATACVFACSSATCESTFSCMNRILTPFRQSMLFGRESNLTILPYEKSKTENLETEKILRVFHRNYPRRIQLY